MDQLHPILEVSVSVHLIHISHITRVVLMYVEYVSPTKSHYKLTLLTSKAVFVNLAIAI